MKKFARLAITSSLLAAMLGIGAAPASAHNGECVVATGAATLGAGPGGLWQPVNTGGGPGLHNPSVEISGTVALGAGCVGFDGAPFVPTPINVTVEGNGLPSCGDNGGCVVPATPDFRFNTGHGGYCGDSNGSGDAFDTDAFGVSSTHNFHWTGLGTQLFLTGEVFGVVNAVVDSTHPHTLGHGNSCTNGTAHHFLVNGEVNFQGY